MPESAASRGSLAPVPMPKGKISIAAGSGLVWAKPGETGVSVRTIKARQVEMAAEEYFIAESVAGTGMKRHTQAEKYRGTRRAAGWVNQR